MNSKKILLKKFKTLKFFKIHLTIFLLHTSEDKQLCSVIFSTSQPKDMAIIFAQQINNDPIFSYHFSYTNPNNFRRTMDDHQMQATDVNLAVISANTSA